MARPLYVIAVFLVANIGIMLTSEDPHRVWVMVSDAVVIVAVVACIELIRRNGQAGTTVHEPTPSQAISPHMPATTTPLPTFIQLVLVTIWLVADIAIRIVLGPIWGNAIVGVLGAIGVWKFCDWHRRRARVAIGR